MAAELPVGGPDSFGQVAVEVLGDQVGDHLGVGLGTEDEPLGLEFGPDLGVVLDDAVEGDLDVTGLVRMRMGSWLR